MRQLVIIAVHVLISAVFAAISGLAAHKILMNSLSTARAEMLQSYIRVRADREQTLFDEARTLTEAAEAAFLRRLSRIEGEEIVDEFDALFPPFGDGTRRSHPDLFDGRALPGADYVFGIGSYLGDGEQMTIEERRRYMAGFHVVRVFGEAHLGEFSSLYYFTPDRRVVIFAPEREDRLAFYRYEAPADFNLQADEDPRLFSPETNPESLMQCTRLSRFVYTDGGERSATACRKPIRVDGELMGAFGTSIDMTEHLASSMEAPPAGGVNLVFDRDGNVIARGQTVQQARAFGIDPVEIMGLLRDDPRPRGVVGTPRSEFLVAFSRIAGPDWYFVSVSHLAEIKATATRWGWRLFFFIFVVSVVITSLRGLLRRTEMVRAFLEPPVAAPTTRRYTAAPARPDSGEEAPGPNGTKSVIDRPGPQDDA
ncbi:cache domain-containing protein [uncultured Maricaulis sp.]|uniref:cache domain-containing protein n=1 Tax=uncultured Maricaulis sp. TaxID=174710 RepID=UPI00260F0655|nr:cache domain-containing protein [uncultured Maricaulis sp.]